MFSQTVTFVLLFIVFEVNFSKSNDFGPVTFERLELVEKMKPSPETEWIEDCKCVLVTECISNQEDPSIDIRIITNPNKCSSGKVYCCSDPLIENPLLICGKVTTKDIEGIKIRPDQAKFGEFPWQVLILTNSNSFVSNGALIDSKHVLLTAHYLTNFLKNISAIKVRLGDWDISANVEPDPSDERSVAGIAIHPGYSPSTMHNDVAVITLSEPVTVSGHVRPVCLPPGPSVTRLWTGCRVSGWGSESFERPRYPGVLKKVNVPLWDRDRCVQSLRTTRLGDEFVLHDGFLCAGGEEREDACKGDGGSPLVCDFNSVTYLVGLVSWGIGCGTKSIPGVYIDVGIYNTWIEKQINSEKI